ncbi:MAG TPA: sugar transferase [Miltoncostaeales bacterium]|nr:sugar transferase [Miltoncostaeales bacterium]
MSPHDSSQPAVGGRAKRIMDLAIAVPALVVLSPVLVLIAILVRRDSPGPAIFKQRRAGLHGNEFDLLKFRSMVDGAESIGSGLTVQVNDDRITKLGRLLRRTSLDELPQLINVVRGEMSIVGPRPTIASQISRYTDEQRRRLDARPGITGLAQVRGRASLPWSTRIALDLEYINGWSLRSDLTILARTLLVVVRGSDTYRGEVAPFDLPERSPAEEQDPARH